MPTSISNGESGLSVRTKLNTIWTNLVTSQITLGDDEKAIFGAGSDLQIYHSGSESVIHETGTGPLRIRSNSATFIQNGGGTETLAHFGNNGAVTLYYDNAAKLATTATGIDVTGTVTSDGLTVEADSGGGSGSTTPVVAVISDTDGGGSWVSGTIFAATDYKSADGSGAGSGVRVRTGIAQEASSGSTSSYIVQTAPATAGTMIDRLKISSGGDISFYEDTGTTAKFHWDAANERLGIGNAAPNTTLDITTTSNTNGFRLDVIGTAPNYMFDVRDDGTSKFRIDGSGNVGISTSSPKRHLHINGGNETTKIQITNQTTGSSSDGDGFQLGIATDGTANIEQRENADLVFATNATERLRIDSAGLISAGPFGGGGNVIIAGSSSPSYTNQAGTNLHLKSGDGSGSGSSYMTFSTSEGGASGTTVRTAQERMRIDSLGNVGIGEVPQTDLNTSYDHLQIGKPANIMGSDTNGGLWLNSGAFFNSAGNWEHLLSSETVSSLTMTNSIPFRFRYAAAGTAGNTFSWSEAARIDASGNLLVGSTDASPSNNSAGSTADNGLALKDNGELQVAAYKDTASTGSVVYFNRTSTDGDIIDFRKDGAAVGSIGASNGDLTIGTTDVAVRFSDSDNQIYPINITTRAAVNGATTLGNPAARFKDLYLSGDVISGQAFIGGPTDIGYKFHLLGDAAFERTGTTSQTMAVFRNGNGNVGTISTSGSATAYNTSSDYRLKTDAQPMTGATDRLKQLNPVNFEWIADGIRVDGFLAHEAQAVVPEAVTGIKDAMRDEEYEVTPAITDDDGNVVTEAVMGTRSVPDYQGIDQSKMVPLLVKTIQELEARITTLEG